MKKILIILTILLITLLITSNAFAISLERAKKYKGQIVRVYPIYRTIVGTVGYLKILKITINKYKDIYFLEIKKPSGDCNIYSIKDIGIIEPVNRSILIN